MKQIKILVPTEQEAASLADLPAHVQVVVSGVGMVRTATAVVREAALSPGAVFILAGIAGAYPDSGLRPGDCVVVGHERVADQGAFRGGRFQPLYTACYDSPLAGGGRSLPVVVSNSVDVGGADFVLADSAAGGAHIENMEGAAFFAVCRELGVPFIEVRAVSNITTDSRQMWRIGEAVDALAAAVKKIIDEIES